MLSLPPQLGDLSAGEAAAGAPVSGWEEGPAPPLLEALPGDTSGGRGRGAVQFITNQVYWKNPIYIQTLCGPAPAQQAGGGTR